MGFPPRAATEEEAQQRRERNLARQAYEEAYAKTLMGQYEAFRNAAKEFRDTILDHAFELMAWVIFAGLMLALGAGVAAAYVWLLT